MMEGLREGCFCGGIVKNGRGFVKVGEGMAKNEWASMEEGWDLGRLGWARMELETGERVDKKRQGSWRVKYGKTIRNRWKKGQRKEEEGWEKGMKEDEGSGGGGGRYVRCCKKVRKSIGFIGMHNGPHTRPCLAFHRNQIYMPPLSNPPIQRTNKEHSRNFSHAVLIFRPGIC
jgi:hypothetical protein